jgi:two-component system, LuxR family, sensor kinase FixL
VPQGQFLQVASRTANYQHRVSAHFLAEGGSCVAKNPNESHGAPEGTALDLGPAVAEAPLRESEPFRWLAAITESSDDAIISKTLDGSIMSWNQGAERLFGYPAEEVVGMPITILIPPDRQNEERMILEQIAGEKRVDHYETVRLRKDGSSVMVSLTVSPVKNAEGGVIGASKIARDVTERKQAEARENALITQLADMNRIATAGELSASIAHEVTQPLTGILLMANAALRLLASEPPDVGKARDVLTDIVGAGQRVNDIISTLRAMFRKGTEQKTLLDTNKQIRSVLEIVQYDLRKQGIESRISLDKNLPSVTGNKVQLQQVILNLMMNAIESMIAGEPRILSVESKATELNRVRISIADTGSGIDPGNCRAHLQTSIHDQGTGHGHGLVDLPFDYREPQWAYPGLTRAGQRFNFLF